MEEKSIISPQATYNLSVSTTNKKQLKDVNGIAIQRHATFHRVYHFSLMVISTNRAAVTEYIAVLRPENSGRRAYEYLERTAIVRNQVGEYDTNTPVLEFDSEGKLFLRLLAFESEQNVKVIVTQYL